MHTDIISHIITSDSVDIVDIEISCSKIKTVSFIAYVAVLSNILSDICGQLLVITVKMLGGARKSFPAGVINLDCDGYTLAAVISRVHECKPPHTPPLDTRNVLLAVNGADSSSLGGSDTILNDGDVVSIIPVIHGGSGVIHWTIGDFEAAAICVPADMASPDILRPQFPGVYIQSVDRDFVLDSEHLRRILEISVAAHDTDTMLTDHIETDILLRLALTTQISAAISQAGVASGPAIVIALGNDTTVQRLAKHLEDMALPFPDGHDKHTSASLISRAKIPPGLAGDAHALGALLAEHASLL